MLLIHIKAFLLIIETIYIKYLQCLRILLIWLIDYLALFKGNEAITYIYLVLGK